MPHRRPFRPAQLARLAAVLALAVSGTARAGLFVHPVADLRQALRAPVRDEADLVRRRDTLDQRVRALRTVVELRDALALHEWRDEDLDPRVARVDREIRNVTVCRFEQSARYLLQHGDARSRLAVVTLLSELDVNLRGVNRQTGVAHDLAPVLAALLHEPDPELRRHAALALGRINPEPGVAAPALGGLQRAPDPGPRRAAAEGQLEWVRSMAQSVKDTTGLNRPGARAAIVRTGCALLPVAGLALADVDPSVRHLHFAALDAMLGALADVIGPMRPVGNLEPEEAQAYRADVAAESSELGPLTRAIQDQLPALLRALRNADAETRLAAHHALEQVTVITLRLQFRSDSVCLTPTASGQWSGQRQVLPLWAGLRPAVPVLAEGLRDPDVRVRRSALDVLEWLGPMATPAVPALTAALTDPDRFVRWAAVRTLGKVGPVDADMTVPALARLLADPDLDVGLAAATTLRRYGPEARAALPVLVRTVGMGDAELRVAAVHALDAIGPEALVAIPALDGALNNPDPRVRQAAVDLLGKLAPIAENATPPLRRALADADLVIRQSANDALLRLAPVVAPTLTTAGAR